MKFTKTGARSSNYATKVNLLIEALPWIKHTTGKTVLIKYGGSAMENPELMAQVMTDIVLPKNHRDEANHRAWRRQDISAAFEKSGMPVEFKDGLRVTPDDAMELVRMVLVGSVNRRLVDAINVHGHLAVGVSGGDGCTIRATQLDPELGRVGEVTSIDPTYLEHLINDDYIPIVASVAAGDDGKPFNINADIAAGHLAAALHAHKIIFLSDVDGLYKDFSDKDTLISSLTSEEARELVESGTLSSGMIPKIEACLAAPRCGHSRRTHHQRHYASCAFARVAYRPRRWHHDETQHTRRDLPGPTARRACEPPRCKCQCRTGITIQNKTKAHVRVDRRELP